jgi:hypothetical protein
MYNQFMAVGTVSSRLDNQAKDAAAQASRARSTEKKEAPRAPEPNSAAAKKERTHEAATQPSNRGGESSRAASYKTAAGPGGALSGGSVGGRVNVKA